MLSLSKNTSKNVTNVSKRYFSQKSSDKKTIEETINSNSSFAHKVKNIYTDTKNGFKKKLNDNFTPDQLERANEWGSIGGSMVALGAIHQTYQKNKDNFNENFIKEKIDHLNEYTLPKNFKEKSLQDARIDINHALDRVMYSQGFVSEARGVTNYLSPAFTCMPVLANPAFATALCLSMGDVLNIVQILRIKKMIDMRPDVFSEDEKKQYTTKIKNVEKHIPKEIMYDALKIFYRGQLVAVNRKLKEHEKPQLNYKDDLLKKMADNRYIPFKNNLKIVGWILPTSYTISKLAAEDTKAMKDDLEKLDTFFKHTAFKGADNNS
jgi:hypothetical protein